MDKWLICIDAGAKCVDGYVLTGYAVLVVILFFLFLFIPKAPKYADSEEDPKTKGQKIEKRIMPYVAAVVIVLMFTICILSEPL